MILGCKGLTMSSLNFNVHSFVKNCSLEIFSVNDELEPSKICVADVSFLCRFYSRDSGLLKFKIHAGFLGRPIPPTGKRLVAFTFHPLYPFAISVQKTNAEYVVNFHIRHLTSGVEHT